jgi:hypothetical protein
LEGIYEKKSNKKTKVIKKNRKSTKLFKKKALE